MPPMKPLSRILRDWRENLGITRTEAARRCGLSQPLWGQLEAGTRLSYLQARTIDLLAAGTGIPVERLDAAVVQERLERRRDRVRALEAVG